MSNGISFFVTGEPRGQPRPRAFVFRGQARIYNPAQAESWKTCISAAAQPHIPTQPFTGPICLELTFYFPRPKSHFGTGKNALHLKPNAPTWHTQKPDRDNAEKAVMDAMTLLGFWTDDCQVCSGEPKKIWCPPGMKPGCQITLVPLEERQENEQQKEMFTPNEEAGLLCNS